MITGKAVSKTIRNLADDSIWDRVILSVSNTLGNTVNDSLWLSVSNSVWNSVWLLVYNNGKNENR
jgi:hypothetical protein